MSPPAPINARSLRAGIAFTPRTIGNRVTGISVGEQGDGSAFAAAGFRCGDVIRAVNGRPVASASDVAAIASQLHDRNQAFTLFATHYFELTEFPVRHERAINLHVSAVEAGHDIVFLHEIQPGPASRSYGIQVARLAGMPAAVVNQARHTLEALEAQATESNAQVDLFAAPPVAQSAEASAVEAALSAIDPDTLSPRDALDALYQLKKLSASNR